MHLVRRGEELKCAGAPSHVGVHYQMFNFKDTQCILISAVLNKNTNHKRQMNKLNLLQSFLLVPSGAICSPRSQWRSRPPTQPQTSSPQPQSRSFMHSPGEWRREETEDH